MKARELLERKKRGDTLTADEIAFLIEGFTDKTIPDYQMAAWLMAVWFRGLDSDETLALTRHMMQSGAVVDLSDIPGFKVDKHSTGGIGDKVSLPLVGIAAACGLRVPMLSGRGLGHTGGTLDKLESIPGYRIDFDEKRFRRALEEVGAVIIGQTSELVPADQGLYALRDVTATVDCIPLIVASILSKKFAAGVDGVVLDVKVGSGAFMRSLEDARELARCLVDVGARFDRRVSVLFTRMDEPLGDAVGNALEVIEAVSFLRGEGPDDLRQVTEALCAEMLLLADAVPNREAAQQKVVEVVRSGAALQSFRRMVEFQGGSLQWDAPDCGLRLAPEAAVLEAPREAVLQAVDGYEVGMSVVDLGGGRQRKEDRIDASVGLLWKVRIGDRVQRGQPLVAIHAGASVDVDAVQKRLQGALQWGDDAVDPQPVVLGRLDAES
jgi:pyrimidine-nucleoside phosphorylase/thymidine phosphorylase